MRDPNFLTMEYYILWLGLFLAHIQKYSMCILTPFFPFFPLPPLLAGRFLCTTYDSLKRRSSGQGLGCHECYLWGSTGYNSGN